jgi:hypothetical protein
LTLASKVVVSVPGAGKVILLSAIPVIEMTKAPQQPIPIQSPSKPLLALGMEGSANKLGIGLILHSPLPPDHPYTQPQLSALGNAKVEILSNIRHTYVTPPGEGFQPADTARHHKKWIIEVLMKCLKEGGKTMEDVDVICFTKGELSGFIRIYIMMIYISYQDLAWVRRYRQSHWSLVLSL